MITASLAPSAPDGHLQRSRPTVALVLSNLGVMLFGNFAPLAWAIANKELAAIDAGGRPSKNRTTANAGRLLGVVGTVVGLGGLLPFVLALVGIIKSRESGQRTGIERG